MDEAAPRLRGAGQLRFPPRLLELPWEQSAETDHLAELRASGLTTTRPDTQTIYYRLSDVLAGPEALTRQPRYVVAKARCPGPSHSPLNAG